MKVRREILFGEHFLTLDYDSDRPERLRVRLLARPFDGPAAVSRVWGTEQELERFVLAARALLDVTRED